MKVAIVIPTARGQVESHFAMSLAGMVAAIKGVQISIINAKSAYVHTNRNNGVGEAIQRQTDFVFFIDSDMSFPSNTFDRLKNFDKDIVGCNYLMRGPPHNSLAWPMVGKSLEASGVTEVERLPTGILLIKTHVFKQMKRPWFFHRYKEDGEEVGEDYNFCDMAREAGFSIWMDCSLSTEIIHWGEMGFRWAGKEECELVESV